MNTLGMSFALFIFMSIPIHPRMKLPVLVAKKIARVVGDHVDEQMGEFSSIIPTLRKKELREIGKKYARREGFIPVEPYGDKLRMFLKDQLKLVIKMKKLKHADVAKMIGSSRSKVTRMLGGKNVSIDFLLMTLAVFGFEVELTFKNARS